jgi:hypothetical protein
MLLLATEQVTELHKFAQYMGQLGFYLSQERRAQLK